MNKTLKAAEDSLDASVSLYLKYEGEFIAQYRFDSLSDANAFIVKMNAIAQNDPGVKVGCMVFATMQPAGS